MNKRKVIVWAVTLLAVALLAWKLHSSHFDWLAFWKACRSVDWRLLLLAVAVLYTNFIFRAARWSLFLKPSLAPGERVHWFTLLPSQFIGFTGLAILGRIGELIRPYLVSRRTGLPFSSQLGVVAVERIFDLGAFGLLFGGNLLLSRQLNALPYHERYHLLGYAILGIVVFLSLFVAFIRFAGESMARVFGKVAGKISPSAGESIAAKILEFRSGLNTVSSLGHFILICLYSVLTWVSIAIAYVIVMRAFPAPVHDLTLSHILLLMGFSVVGSVVQLPGIGGGAQVMTIGALTVLFHIPNELASSAGIILWAIVNMSVIPAGLLFARAEQVSLSSLAKQSDDAAEQPVPVN
jgi:uncharacterized protein (TIRG00374 family)